MNVYTNDEDWFIARDREHLAELLEEMVGAQEALEEAAEMRQMGPDERLKIDWCSAHLPAWASDPDVTIEDPGETWGDGWDRHVSATAGTFARLAGEGCLASIHF